LFDFTKYFPSFTEREEEDDIIFADFNNDNSCIVLGTVNGFRVYKIFPFIPHPEVNCGGCQHVCMLFSTSLFALVGNGDSPENTPRKLRLFNVKSRTQLCELNFKDTVLNVKMSKQRMVVVLPDNIHIFDLSDMTLLHRLDTPQNIKGICDFSFYNGQHLICFPTSNSSGKVMIFDVLNLQVRCGITAHENPIRCIKFNPTAQLIATASTCGTIIRLTRIEDGERLFTFRRGGFSANITCLSFSSVDKFLAVSSENNSTHLFSYDDTAPLDSLDNWRNRKGSFIIGLGSSLIPGVVTNYLPESVKETLEPERSFDKIAVTTPSGKSGAILSVCFHDNGELFICNKSGVLYRYQIDRENGHTLLDEQSLRPANDEIVEAKFLEQNPPQDESMG